MAQVLTDPALAARRQDWIQRVQNLANQITAWAQAEGWNVTLTVATITEPLLGTYNVPHLAIRLQGGELYINPIGLHSIGGNGRVDIESVPTLNRVKLIGVGQGDWTIMTDSNVPLRMPWNQATFATLAHDLLA